MNDILAHKIKQCPTLPTLPQVALEIINLADNPDVALPALAKIISRDAALVGKTLKTVNSSFYGLSHTVSSVEHALVVLGLDGIKTVALGFSLVAGLKKTKPQGGFDHLTYWRRSLYSATAARVFAERFVGTYVEEAFLSALLMDVGMLALDQVLGKEYATVTGRAPSHSGLAPLEMAKLGMTHAEVAGVLAEHWKLPEILSIPMTSHHRPQTVEDGAARDVARVVWLAGRCADVFVDAQPEWSLCDVRRACMEQYKVNELECDSILCQIGMKTNQLAPMFEIPLEAASTGGYDAILKRANDGLASMTEALHADEGADDKRRAPRFSRGGTLAVHPYTGGKMGPATRAEFRDASAQGLGLTVTFPASTGSQFVLRLPHKDGGIMPVLYTVVRSRRVHDREYQIGAELTSVLRQEPRAPGEVATTPGKSSEVDRIRNAILKSA